MMRQFLFLGALGLAATSYYTYQRLTTFQVWGTIKSADHERILVFDFDGTLADSLPLLVKTYNTLAPTYGTKLATKQDQELVKHLDTQELLQHFSVSRWQLPFIARKLRKESVNHFDEVKPFPGLKPTLQELSKRYHVGIATSNSLANVLSFLKKYDLNTYIQFIIGDIGTFSKPKALQAVINQSGLPPGKIMYIGDELRDGEAANKVGIPFGAVNYGFNSEKTLKKAQPLFVVSSLERIPKALHTKGF